MRSSAVSIACSSTPVRGVGTYTPSAKFAAPRSYFTFVRTGLFGWTVHQTDNKFRYTNPVFLFDEIDIIIDPRFWDWSSDAWTFDHIVCESYYDRLSTGVHDPAPFAVRRTTDSTSGLPGLEIYNTDGIFLLNYEDNLAQAPSSYWLPGV